MISNDRPHPHPAAPIPGTAPPARGLFIDRWGTLLELPTRGFRASFSDTEFTPQAVESLFRASQAGWNIYLIGNEDAVARGRLSMAKWQQFEANFLAHLRSQGVPIKRNYACLDHPEHGCPERLKDSVFRLPNTGAMYHAMQHDGIRLDQSWVIGDSTLELAAGWRSGCRLAGVRTGLALDDQEFEIDPNLVRENLNGVLAEILVMAAAARL